MYVAKRIEILTVHGDTDCALDNIKNPAFKISKLLKSKLTNLLLK
jgi:hypothetical protein